MEKTNLATTKLSPTQLNFAKMNGLLPVVIQDYTNGQVLMVGFMNEEAWHKTLETKKVHYYSRKKKRLWMKGEESGHWQHVREIYLDNDNDTLLIKVKQIGGACEDGLRSCFDKMMQHNEFKPIGEKIFDPKKVYANYSEEIILAIPSGSLYATTILLMTQAGFELELRGERSFKPRLKKNDDVRLVVARAQEIPHLIESGKVDIGLTGNDMIEEYDVSVTDLADLGYNESGIGEVLWVLAVPQEHVNEYSNLADFSGKKICTELMHITKKYFLENYVQIDIEPSVGTTESKAPFLCDAIIDLCESGKSLKDNGMIPLYAVKSSTVHLFAHNHSMAYGWKRRKIEKIVDAFKLGAQRLPKNPKSIIKLPKL